MLENGLDFIRSGLKHIATPVSKFDLKYAILHLSAGIRLALKDRLVREDWTQIFVKPEDATEEKLRSGNFKSVTLKQCLERLEEHCPVVCRTRRSSCLSRISGIRSSISR